MGSGGSTHSVGDFRRGVRRDRIDFLVVHRLAKTGSGGSLDNGKAPVAALMNPTLHEGYIFFVARRGVFQGKSELEGNHVHAGLRISFLHQVGGKLGQPFGFQRRPESDLILERDQSFAVEAGDARSRTGVESREGGRIAGKYGGRPETVGNKVGARHLAR